MTKTADAARPRSTPATSFGFRDVAENERQGLVNEVFSKVAERYDQMNDLMSAGLHRLWKDDFVAMLNPPLGQAPFHHLDVAGGTGDIAFRIARVGGPNVRVTVTDISPEMVGEGRKRAEADGLLGRCSFSVGNAEALPFPDKSFDLVTIAFGLRNVTDKAKALRDMHRVLKVGGRVLVLEFSQVKPEWFRPIYDFHSFKILPKLGKLFANDSDSDQYLAESIRKHPNQEGLQAMMAEAGFGRCSHRNLSGGIVAIHSAYRI